METVEDIATRLKQIAWGPREHRAELQRFGVTVVPSDFYSTVPSIADIEGSFEHASPMPYLSAALFDAPRLLAVLEDLREHAGELSAPLDSDPDSPDGFFWNNGQFGFSDAAAYYALLRRTRPRRVLEIGAGFSTLVASAAIEANGIGEIICIEPYPRAFLGAIPHVREIVRAPVQTISPDWVNALLGDGDVLFIDSTHTVKIGSDCLHLYLRLLPALTRRLLVHVHDVFLPAGMPAAWALEKHIYWTEQYLLLAYLLDNPTVQVVWGSYYHYLTNPATLSTMTPAGVPIGGSSFWFERNPAGTNATPQLL